MEPFFVFMQPFEFWLNRYQTLVVGLIAVGVAVLQVRLAWRQGKIMETQQEQVEAIRALSLARMLGALRPLMGYFIGGAAQDTIGHDADGWPIRTWNPAYLENAANVLVDWDEDAALLAVAAKHPDLLADVHQLLTAFKALREAYPRWKAKPWDNDEGRDPAVYAQFDAYTKAFNRIAYALAL